MSLILSRLYYCSSVLAGLPKCSLRPLQPLQLAQNMEALLVYRARRSCHIILLLLQELDWLPINKRIEEKILKFLVNSRTVSAHHTFQTCLTRKYIRTPLDQLMATVLQPRYSKCVRSISDLSAHLDLDCGMTFHYHFGMTHKTVPAPIPPPHYLLSFLILIPLITPPPLQSAPGVECRLGAVHK